MEKIRKLIRKVLNERSYYALKDWKMNFDFEDAWEFLYELEFKYSALKNREGQLHENGKEMLRVIKERLNTLIPYLIKSIDSVYEWYIEEHAWMYKSGDENYDATYEKIKKIVDEPMFYGQMPLDKKIIRLNYMKQLTHVTGSMGQHYEGAYGVNFEELSNMETTQWSNEIKDYL